MTAQAMIKHYDIMLEYVYDKASGKIVRTGRLLIRNKYRIKSPEERESIAARKEEITAILIAEKKAKEEAEKRAYDERKAKIDAIEGLCEISTAIAELDAWQAKFERSFYGPNACGGLGVGPRPTHDIDAMKAAYPRAAAYLMANDWSHADHDVKASAGKKALEKIINGDDYGAAIDEMRHEWDAYTELHAFD